MTSRTASRRAAISSAGLTMAVGLVLLAAPAYATVDDGSEPGDGLSVIETLFYFVGIPLALFVGIALLVSLPSMVRGPRYRPGLGWWAAPIWFNGPESADTAVRTAPPTLGGGGASARW